MDRTSRLLAALAVNMALVVGQLVAGLVAHSAGLLADAGHNFTDAAALVLSLGAVRWAMRPRSEERSFGNYRGTILAALVNAAALAVATVAIVFESIRRLLHPVHVDGGVVVIVAAVAIGDNAVAAVVLHEDSADLNMRAALLHMVADVLASLFVFLAGLAILLGGPSFDRLDPIASLVVALFIIVEAVKLVRESVDVLLEATPADVDLAELRRAIVTVPGVDEVHDVHVWSLSSEFRALSAHLLLSGHPTLEEAQDVGNAVRRAVGGPFNLAHTTFELECERCVDEIVDPCGVDGVDVASGPVASATD